MCTGRGDRSRDGENYEAKLSFGTKLGARTHLLLSAARAEQSGISLLSRDWYTSTGAIQAGGVGRGHVGGAGANSGWASGGDGEGLASRRTALHPGTERYSLFAFSTTSCSTK